MIDTRGSAHGASLRGETESLASFSSGTGPPAAYFAEEQAKGYILARPAPQKSHRAELSS